MTTTRKPTRPIRIETSSGTAVWCRLEWDTEQLGIQAARVESLEAQGSYREVRERKGSLLRDVLNQCRGAGINHISARVQTDDLPAIHALEAAGFELIDGIQTLSLSLQDYAPSLPRCTRLFQPADMDEVIEIGRTAYTLDRFHVDPAVRSAAADGLNAAWTRNCCTGEAADAVLIAEVDGRVASYVACQARPRNTRGVIVLVATAEWARGRGAARRATLAALDWFASQAIQTVEVGTQLANVRAARLYENLGFRMCRTSLTFRKVFLCETHSCHTASL